MIIVKIKKDKALLVKNTDGYLQQLKEIKLPGMTESPEVSVAKIMLLLRNVKAFNEEVHIIPDFYRVETVQVVPTKKEIKAVASTQDNEMCIYDVQKDNTVLLYYLDKSYEILLNQIEEASLIPKIYTGGRMSQAILSKINARTASILVEPNFIELTVINEGIMHTERVETGLSDYIQALEGCTEEEVISVLLGYQDGTAEVPVKVSKILDMIYRKTEELKEEFLPYAIAIIGTLSKAIAFEDTEEFPLIKVNPGGEWMKGLSELRVQELNPMLFPIPLYEMEIIDGKQKSKPVGLFGKSATNADEGVELIALEDDGDDNYSEDNELSIDNYEEEYAQSNEYNEEQDYETVEEPKKKNKKGRVTKASKKTPKSAKKPKGKSLFGRKKPDEGLDIGDEEGYTEEYMGDYEEIFNEEPPKKGRRKKVGKSKSTNMPTKKANPIKSLMLLLIVVMIGAGGYGFYVLDPMGLFNSGQTDDQYIDDQGQEPYLEDNRVTDIDGKIELVKELKSEYGFGIIEAYESGEDFDHILTVELTDVREEDVDKINEALSERYSVSMDISDNGIIFNIR